MPGERRVSGTSFTTMPMVRISTALSEMTLPTARITAVTIPPEAAGKTMRKMVRTFPAPRAYAPFLKESGTARRLSSVERTMTGRIMMAKVIPPPRRE